MGSKNAFVVATVHVVGYTEVLDETQLLPKGWLKESLNSFLQTDWRSRRKLISAKLIAPHLVNKVFHYLKGTRKSILYSQQPNASVHPV
jgi:hypothetical protein